MRKRMIRRTVLGAAAGALAFIGLGLYLNVANGAPALSNPGPLAMLAVVGGTIGGLVGPLFRRRSADPEGPGSGMDVGGAEGAAGGRPEGAREGRPESAAGGPADGPRGGRQEGP